MKANEQFHPWSSSTASSILITYAIPRCQSRLGRATLCLSSVLPMFMPIE